MLHAIAWAARRGWMDVQGGALGLGARVVQCRLLPGCHHPGTQGPMALACRLQSITMWGFWDGEIWTPRCGIVRADGTPKASGVGRAGWGWGW